MTSTSEAEHVTEWGRELGVHLRALRRLAGLSQGRLASIVGTSQAALSRLERATSRNRSSSWSASHKWSPAHSRASTRWRCGRRRRRSFGSSVARDPGLEELVHLYRDASPTQRRGMLATVRAWRASPRDAGDPDSSVGGAGE